MREVDRQHMFHKYIHILHLLENDLFVYVIGVLFVFHMLIIFTIRMWHWSVNKYKSCWNSGLERPHTQPPTRQPLYVCLPVFLKMARHFDWSDVRYLSKPMSIWDFLYRWKQRWKQIPLLLVTSDNKIVDGNPLTRHQWMSQEIPCTCRANSGIDWHG